VYSVYCVVKELPVYSVVKLVGGSVSSVV